MLQILLNLSDRITIPEKRIFFCLWEKMTRNWQIKYRYGKFVFGKRDIERK